MTLSPGDYDIIIYQGATLSEVFTWKDSAGELIDLTGYTAALMARTGVDDSTAFINLSSPDTGIVLGDAEGTITVTMTAEQTAALTDNGGEYDLKLTDGSGSVYRLLHGSVFVMPAVTR